MSTWTPNSEFNRFRHIGLQRGLLFGVIILTAILAFEAFNFSTTQYALSDLLGNLTFASFQWSTILSIAFCGIDFAGIARLFSPISDQKNPTEVWYLFGAWMLAAIMNAMLTWWGVSIALTNHPTQSSTVIDPNLVIRAVPIVVAVMVWLIRILIIGTFSMAGERIFTTASENAPLAPENRIVGSSPSHIASQPSPYMHSAYHPTHRPVWTSESPAVSAAANESHPTIHERPEPTYHNLSANAHSPDIQRNTPPMH